MVLELKQDSIDIGMSIAMERQRLWGLELSSDAPVAGDALTSCFATYYALMHSFQDHLPTLGVGNAGFDKESFHLFALYAGAVKGGEKLCGGNASTRYNVNFGSRKFSDYPMALDHLIQRITQEVLQEKKQSQRLSRAADALSSVERSVLSKVSVSEAASLHVRVGDTDFSGFSYAKSGSKAAETKVRTPSERPFIVGNEQALSLIDQYCRILSLYDPTVQKNPFFHGVVNPRPLSLLLEGRPGCGKTLMIRYAESSLADIAKAKDMDFDPLLIDNSFKDRWHGSDAQNLRRYFTQAEDPASISSLSIDDAESVFPRRDSSEASFVEKGNVNSLLQFMNGLTTIYNGNYLVLAATNCPDQLDPAVSQRFQEHRLISGPTSPDHYLSLFRIGLGQHFPDVSSRLGRFCFQHSLSGRSVDNVLKWAQNYVQNPGMITKDMSTEGYETNLACLESMKRPLTEELLFARLEEEIKSDKGGNYL